MDRGPLRVSRPAETRATSRPEPVRRVEETPQASVEPRIASTPRASHKAEKEKKSKRWLPISISVVVLLLGITAWFAWSKMAGATPAVDTSKYQAVYLMNGQWYFGKMGAAGANYLKLTDVYYLETQTTDSTGEDGADKQATSNASNLKLVKLGTEVHGPEDTMIISRDQVLMYENLKDDGKVVQAIKQYKDK